MLAARGDSVNDRGRDFDVELATGKIIEKKQRLGTLDEYVVDAHGHEVDADRIVSAELSRKHQFRADAIRTRYEHGLTVLPWRQRKQAAESANAMHDLRASSARDVRLDAVDERVARVNVDAGVFVRQRFVRHRHQIKRMVAPCGGDIISVASVEGKRPYMKFQPSRGRCWPRYPLFLLSLIVLLPVEAIEVASLYTAQVPYDQDEPDARTQAYETALAQVLLRVSGPELVNDTVLFESLFPNPSAYVVRFRPGEEDTLWVSFDGDAVEQTLRQAGQTVWGADRPLTMIWLAVDWGQGVREVIAADDPESKLRSRSVNRNRRLRQRILDFADRRGLPVAFPLLDTEDLAKVEFSDICGGFNGRVIEASKRYDVNSILIGCVRASSVARNRWTYLFSGEERAMTGEPEIVLTRVSNMLAEEFAIAGNAPLRAVQLRVAGITSVDAFGAVHGMLDDISLIEAFSITEVAGDQISFRVQARGGASRLARALRFEGLVEQERLDYGDATIESALASLDFFYSP